MRAERISDSGAPAYRRVIAIDGPAASGKSSVAHLLARRLGYVYVNSGAMYRAVTWHVIARGVDPQNAEAVAQLIANARIDCDLVSNESRILIEGEDVLEHMRDVRVNAEVSPVSSVPRVREVLVARMRAYALKDDVVMEGRDIGSAVFPDTPHKFYIDATPEIRFRRRAAQGQADPIARRDQADSSRRASPLTIAPDAVVIDSSHVSIAEVVEQIIERLKFDGVPLDDTFRTRSVTQ